MNISELAKFMVESFGKEGAEELLEILHEEAVKNVPEETQGKVHKMAEICSEIKECMEEPREIPLELVMGFNKLYSECFPVKKEQDRKRKEDEPKLTGKARVTIVSVERKPDKEKEDE